MLIQGAFSLGGSSGGGGMEGSELVSQVEAVFARLDPEGERGEREGKEGGREGERERREGGRGGELFTLMMERLLNWGGGGGVHNCR